MLTVRAAIPCNVPLYLMLLASTLNSVSSGAGTEEATNIQGILNISMLDVNIMENLLRDQRVTSDGGN